jgi:hypothetical protein
LELQGEPMDTSDRLPSEQVPFRATQIVVAALICGVLAFAAIALAFTWQKPAGDPLMSYIAAAFVVPIVVFKIPFREVMATVTRQNLPPEIAADKVKTLYAEYQVRTLVHNASLEGAAFFNIIVYIVTAVWWSLAVAVVLVAAMIVGFPSCSRFDEWVRRRSEEAQFELQ